MTVYRFTFQVESMMRGYHEYIMIPLLVKNFICEREPDNSREPCAVAVKKQISEEEKIVGN